MRVTKQLLVVAIAAMFVACGNKGNTESDTTTATEQEQDAVKVVSKVTLTTFKADKYFVKNGKEINSTVIE
ncbi:MAG: hypothetical protein IJ759_07115 [Bacteroidales bacterium]|nr:hypothetical protein [Bacteroidales bacterium]